MKFSWIDLVITGSFLLVSTVLEVKAKRKLSQIRNNPMDPKVRSAIEALDNAAFVSYLFLILSASARFY